ncbi:MAG TPA: cysteine desulfurase-like protein [Candidatus Limnocylindrales bacterium]|nr:cysteine desulfurase-like protein [Candidatus Limnocylindrales bacterium]
MGVVCVHALGRAARIRTPGGGGTPVVTPISSPLAFDVEVVRAHFPALAVEHDGRPVVRLDGPGGTQVPRQTIEAIAGYLGRDNANTYGRFAASEATDALLAEVRQATADFLGAGDPGEIAFGANMTTLAFGLSRALGPTLRRGDEIVVTRLDHDANVAPWLRLAEEQGAVVRWVDVKLDDCTLDLAGLERQLGRRTRLVAVGLASNAVGTINDVARIAALAHDAGAWCVVDAVHACPHLPVDVAALGADLLLCSPYKFFGPHLGVLWGRRELLERLPVAKVRPAPDGLPGRWETGTGNHEALAGLLGTFAYLEWLGAEWGGERSGPHGPTGRRARLVAAMRAIRAYEGSLVPGLIEGLGAVRGLRIRGITDAARLDERCPTVAFTLDGHHPAEISASLGRLGIATWDGDYYAYELVGALGLAETGGMVRVGLVHYNTAEEVERLVDALEQLSRPRA